MPETSPASHCPTPAVVPAETSPAASGWRTGGQPLVSIITPVLNGKAFLAACLESTLGQSYPHIEHIVADGGSTDGTLDLLAEYSSRYPGRVRFFTGQDRNGEDGWNKGILVARGDIFGWLGADDMFAPGAIATIVNYYLAHPGAEFVFGGYETVNESGQTLKRFMLKDFDFDEALNDNCHIATTSAFYTRQVIEAVGLLDVSLVPGDYDYWLRMAKHFPPHRLPEVLSRFRLHANRITSAPRARTRHVWVTYRTSLRHGGKRFSRRLRRYLIFRAADFCRPALQPVFPWVRRLLGWPTT